MTDSERIKLGIALAIREGREIDHGTARTIASQWHDGSALTLAFVSTGAIECADSSDLWNALTDDGKLYRQASGDDQTALNWLGTYLVQRMVHGVGAGPIDGWSDMWAPDN